MPLETTRHPYYSSITLDRRIPPSHNRWREAVTSGSSNLYISSHALSGLDISGSYAPSPLSSMSLYLPSRRTVPTSYSSQSRSPEYSYANRSGSSHLSPAMSKRNALIGTLTRTSNDLSSHHFLSQDTVCLMAGTENYLPGIRSTSKQSKNYSRALTTDIGSTLSLASSSESYNANAVSFSNQRTTFRNPYRPIVIERPSITNYVPRPRADRIKLPSRAIRRDRPLIKFLEREDLNPTKVRSLLSAWAKGENLDEDDERQSADRKKDSVRSNDSGIGSFRGSRRSRQKSGDFGIETDEHEILEHGDNNYKTSTDIPEVSSPSLDEGVHLETDDGIQIALSTLNFQNDTEKSVENTKTQLTSYSMKTCELREQIPLEDNVLSKRRVRIRDEKHISFDGKKTLKDENNNVPSAKEHNDTSIVLNISKDSERSCTFKKLTFEGDSDLSLKKSELNSVKHKEIEHEIFEEKMCKLDPKMQMEKPNEESCKLIEDIIDKTLDDSILNEHAISTSAIGKNNDTEITTKYFNSSDKSDLVVSDNSLKFNKIHDETLKTCPLSKNDDEQQKNFKFKNTPSKSSPTRDLNEKKINVFSVEKPSKQCAEIDLNNKTTDEKKPLFNKSVRIKTKRIKANTNTACENSTILNVDSKNDKGITSEVSLEPSKKHKTLLEKDSSRPLKQTIQEIEPISRTTLKISNITSIDRDISGTTDSLVKNCLISEKKSSIKTDSTIDLTEKSLKLLADVKDKEMTSKSDHASKSELKNNVPNEIKTKPNATKKEDMFVNVHSDETLKETKKENKEKMTLNSSKTAKIIKIEILKTSSREKQTEDEKSNSSATSQVSNKQFKEKTEIVSPAKMDSRSRILTKSNSSGSILSSSSNNGNDILILRPTKRDTNESSKSNRRLEKSQSDNLVSHHDLIDQKDQKIINDFEHASNTDFKNNIEIGQQKKKDTEFKEFPKNVNVKVKKNDITRSTTTSFDQVKDLQKNGLQPLQKSFTTECYLDKNKHKTDKPPIPPNKNVMRVNKMQMEKPPSKQTEVTTYLNKTGTDKQSLEVEASSDAANMTVDAKLTKKTVSAITETLDNKTKNFGLVCIDTNLISESPNSEIPKDKHIQTKNKENSKPELDVKQKVLTLTRKKNETENDISITNIETKKLKKVKMDKPVDDIKMNEKKYVQPDVKDAEISDKKLAIPANNEKQKENSNVQRSVSNSEVTTMQTKEKNEKFFKENASAIKRITSVRYSDRKIFDRCQKFDISVLETAAKTSKTNDCQNDTETSQKRKILKYVGVNKTKVKSDEDSNTSTKTITTTSVEKKKNLEKGIENTRDPPVATKMKSTDKIDVQSGTEKTISYAKEIVAVNQSFKKLSVKENNHLSSSGKTSEKDNNCETKVNKQYGQPSSSNIERQKNTTQDIKVLNKVVETVNKEDSIAPLQSSAKTLKNISSTCSEQKVNSSNKTVSIANNVVCIEKRKNNNLDVISTKPLNDNYEHQKIEIKALYKDKNIKLNKISDISNHIQLREFNYKTSTQSSSNSCNISEKEEPNRNDNQRTASDPDSIITSQANEQLTSSDINDTISISATEKSDNVKPIVKKKKPKTEGSEEKIKKKKKKKEAETVAVDKIEDNISFTKDNLQITTTEESESILAINSKDASVTHQRDLTILKEKPFDSNIITEEKPKVIESSPTPITNIPAVDLEDLWFDYNDPTTEYPETLIKKKDSDRKKITIDVFNFLKVLGRGSYGKVMLAELKGRNQYFAIKCLKKDVVLEDNDVECTMIEREVLAMGSSHPYLCTLFCTFQNESHLFFVMEYLSGGDLMFHIQQFGRFEQDRARFYAAEIACALKYLHKHGIIYRDAKLDNICIDADGHIRLVDFGFCKLRVYRKECLPRNLCGTPDYMAPEIIKGYHYNQSVDWWSFGVLLYEMLIGQSPFNGTDEEELFWSVCNEEVFYPRFLTVEAKQLLSMLLEKDPEKRLGMPGCDTGDIYCQPFFHSIDWKKVERKELQPPFKPKLKSKTDVSNFDSDFTMETAILTPTDTEILKLLDQQQFDGFTFTNPNILI